MPAVVRLLVRTPRALRLHDDPCAIALGGNSICAYPPPVALPKWHSLYGQPHSVPALAIIVISQSQMFWRAICFLSDSSEYAMLPDAPVLSGLPASLHHIHSTTLDAVRDPEW